MRLLEVISPGEFRLTKDYVGVDIPPYAILSHTWGDDDEEVTYDDFMAGAGRSKAGYRKIQFCGAQATSDGLRYFWVDTCCINKSNFTELSEAITSMFRWYRDAVKCYVYLSDVSRCSSNAEEAFSRSEWKLEFRKSRWFTRAWTLQELIAPAKVEFFSRDSELLGDKKSLEASLHEITGIPVEVFHGKALHQFSIDERMLWAAKRNAKRGEDKAYCLFGIFDQYMPLIYGEGEEKALIRLQNGIHNSPIHLRPEVTNAKINKIRQWLSPPDPSLNFEKALKQRQANTGLWFLESKEYAAWKQDPASFLWLYGIPGCGKTILSSTVLHNIAQYCANDSEKKVVYFYFDFKDAQKQSPELLVRSLIFQILQQCVKIPTNLDVLFTSCEAGQRQPTLDTYMDVLHHMMQVFPQLYVVLDALDECLERSSLISILEQITAWKIGNLHLLVTSRKEREIEISFATIVNTQNTICLQSKLVNRDILTYIGQRLSDDKSLQKWHKDPDMRHEIETMLMERAHGMFRWVACQLDILGKCRTRSALRKSLATLPPTLDETYERILCAIPEEDFRHAICILQWLAFSLVPLTVEIISETVAIDTKRKPVFDKEDILEDPFDVLSICSSLIVIDVAQSIVLGSSNGHSNIVALAHYSVKEFLISERILQSRAARYNLQDDACNEFIAQSCLGYLLQFKRSDSVSYPKAEKSGLSSYALCLWVEHSQAVTQMTKALSNLIVELLSTLDSTYLIWARFYKSDEKIPHYSMLLDGVPTPLYYASLSGLTEVVRLLIHEANADINQIGGGYGSALQAASARGHNKIIELLLSKGANINLQGEYYGSALRVASAAGHNTIIELLLSKGADINLQGRNYGSALQTAADRGYDKIVDLLLSKGADINLQGELFGTALQTAANRGYDKIVDLLLSKGADVNLQGELFGTALHAASNKGYTKIVGLLLSRGANINWQNREHGSALYVASRNGFSKIVKLLLSKDANMNLQGGFYDTALQAALVERHNTIARLLLTRGADVNLRGGFYGTALQAACHRGCNRIIELLLSKGADVNLQGAIFGTPLRIALRKSNQKIIELLLSRGADVDLP